jgi:hypothetical protein
MSPLEFALEYLLAVALLTAPAEGCEPCANPDLYPTLLPTLQQLAIEWEILDPREVRYVLARSEDFAADLQLLQRRYREFADAPPLCDSERLPDPKTISELLTFNRAYRQYLADRWALGQHGARGLRETIQETDALYQVWDTIRDARYDYFYVTVRRQALRRLRDALGSEAYDTGCLPPHVPVWRFRYVD